MYTTVQIIGGSPVDVHNLKLTSLTAVNLPKQQMNRPSSKELAQQEYDSVNMKDLAPLLKTCLEMKEFNPTYQTWPNKAKIQSPTQEIGPYNTCFGLAMK
jgi:hypothetical protein